ncbi:MAG: histidine--tRNA ligase [Pseudomonadota bacterium]
MHDIFGLGMTQWKWIESQVRSVFEDFGYQEIRTPVLEHIEVFSKTVGDETDIVEKQMYQVVKENESLVLRPEGTAGFMRAVLEHQLHRDPVTQKYYYYLPMFRHERPQKGRLRQFHQFGAEFINDSSPEADAEVIALLDAIYKKLGITEYDIRINSLGCLECRPQMKEALTQFLKPKLLQLCEQCQKRFERATLRILDCKKESCREITANAPTLSACLCDRCKSHHVQLKKRLEEAQIPFIDDPAIVRGLDYYSSTAFEFTSSLLGAQSALGGGGRYDQLAERFGEKPFPAVGFALGMERLVIALEAKNAFPKQDWVPQVYLAPLGKNALNTLFPLAIKLRRAGVWAETSYDPEKSLKSQLKHANRIQAKYTLILGEDELAKGIALLKDMTAQTQVELPIQELFENLMNKVKREN